MNIDMLQSAAVFAVSMGALFPAHSFADHWLQRHHDALTKGNPGWTGRTACAIHVATLTATKLAALLAAFAVTCLPIRPGWWAVALGVDAVSHYWADRRTTLKRLACAVGKASFYDLGSPRPGHDDQPNLGTGAYALDQSWHVAWLFITALIMAWGVR